MHRTSLIIALASCTFAAQANAQLFYVSQERSVSARTDDSIQTFASDATGLFDDSASSSFPEGSAFASATQTSTLGLGSIVAFGDTAAGALNAFVANSSTVLDVTFDLAGPSAFTFEGVLSFVDVNDARITLFEESGDEIFRVGFQPNGIDFVGSLSTSGTLDAGRYRLLATGVADNGSVFDPAGGFDFSFSVVPAPGTGALFACSIFMTRRRRA